jgi:hypothetical protein
MRRKRLHFYYCWRVLNEHIEIAMTITTVAQGEKDPLKISSVLREISEHLGRYMNPETSLAAAATISIGNARSIVLNITGSTAVSAFDQAKPGTWRIIRAQDGFTLNYNSVSMITPTASNVAFSAGDSGFVESKDGGAKWRLLARWRASATSSTPIYADIGLTGSNVALTNGAFTKIPLNSIVFDTNSWWDNTNHRYTPQKAGKYRVTATITAAPSGGVATGYSCGLFKNGTQIFQNSLNDSGGSSFESIPMVAIVDMNGSSDYLEIFVFTIVTAGTCGAQADLLGIRFSWAIFEYIGS